MTRLERTTKLLSDAVVFRGTPVDRAGVTRIRTGDPVERPFARWIGATRCVSSAPDVRALWDRLLAWEGSCGDGMLRGDASTILEASATTATKDGRVLQVLLGALADRPTAPSYPVAAIPRFTTAVPPRKLRNVSHWLLDCLPQVVALSTVAPDAALLLQPVLTEVNRASLCLVGVTSDRVVPWKGEPTRCDRLLIFESDGRRGGGRPLSPLLDLRRRVSMPMGASDHRSGRRIYVSRRDARKNRRWVGNEPEVEALFASRGFDVVSMTDVPFAAAVHMFREASVVAGVNGAGLAHILLSPPGTHVIVLLSDSLIRWHAAAGGARSLWASGAEAAAGQLAALGDSPRFYAHVAAAFEQFCHAFVGPDDLPIAQLSTFLDEVLIEVARGS